ncbi:uncharacterized protein N0V89_012355 [Didymosphaeria variabile]|uniref:Uncharacterized protein n=1 Tax=Didymosphaeria variabile TaxID=1932322 RepID=A0A9W9C5B8_9PLEO|nr:uncharacterized protein N0V89_012355 [Didymosphaeria variabile]KAJ4344611.1 hypothetical protein N0V89_012355 [Didymosphaeria variabile]
MLERGGWWSSMEKLDLEQLRSSVNTSEPWFLSRILSLECCLSSEWTGNGLPAQTDQDSGVFAEISDTDFADLAGGHSGSEGRGTGGLNFTTSICGQFVLVGRETIIYVYHIRSSRLAPATSIVCPRRVLATSMDVSSGRIAVAALLEGRMGMVCELQVNQELSAGLPVELLVRGNNRSYRTVAHSASVLSSQADNFEMGVDAADRQSLIAEPSNLQTPYIESVDVQSNHQSISLHEMHDHRTYAQNYINNTSILNLEGPRHNSLPRYTSEPGHASCTLPNENGTSAYYRHLCSEDDPPRSDALTGQSLSRWFPLTAPSDYLHFLAPRPGFESGKKLRLISSAAHPNDKPGISRKYFFGGCLQSSKRYELIVASGHPTVSSFWGSFGFENRPRRLVPPNCDHYHAVPLSDGHHVLFIEPQTEKLFMGCDAPLGGPFKLLRKVMFVPPSLDDKAPRNYTAAFDMSWGARVVVVFGDTLVLYSIPPDVCKLSRSEQRADSWDVYIAPPFTDEKRTEDHWLNWWDEPSPSKEPGSSPIWPIAVRGQELGKLKGVCEVTIHTKPNITIWGFTSDSQ